MSKHSFTKDFVAGVRDYMPMDARIREIDGDGQPGREARLGELSDHRFYQFDADSLTALAHAIEDLAMDAGSGAVFCACQDFKHFDGIRERYEQLAISIDRVEVGAAGRSPRALRRVKFHRDASGFGQGYWMVAYEGAQQSALLVGRQTEAARHFDEKQFTGFFTFSPRLAGRLRTNMLELFAGRSKDLAEFTRLMAIDQFAKQIDAEFSRQKDEMAEAVRRLQSDASDYKPGRFASDLEKGLTRLQQWKNSLPAILERVQGA